MLILLLMGAPLVLALLISGVGSAYFLWGVAGLGLLVSSTFGVMDNFLLVALPLFIFMGLMLQRSGITDDLFEIMHKLMGGLPGGLGIGTVIICAIIAAMAGGSGAAPPSTIWSSISPPTTVSCRPLLPNLSGRCYRR